MAAEVLDLEHISSSYSIPQDTVQSLLDTPTADLVRTLLQAIDARSRDHEQVKSQNLKLSVELENAVRGGETKTRVLKGSIDKASKEAAELKQRLLSEGKSAGTGCRSEAYRP